MAYNPNNPNGQTTAANSAPVVVASDQLPAGAVLADAAANPTTTQIKSALSGYNGTTWDRLRSSGNNSDLVAVETLGVLKTADSQYGYNGTSWDRLKTSSALGGTVANSAGTSGISASGIGPGYALRYDPTNLATAVSSTSVINVDGALTAVIGIETATTGTIIFEGTSDGTNWFTADIYNIVDNLWVTIAFTPAIKTYYIPCAGLRQIRLRTVSTLGATVAHSVNMSLGNSIIQALDTIGTINTVTGVTTVSTLSSITAGAPPHNFGYTLVHKDAEYTTTQSGTAIWIPTSTKKFVITDITIATGGTTAATVTLWQGSSGDTTYTAGTDPAIFRGTFAPSTLTYPGVVKPFPVPYVSTTADHYLRVTTSAAITLYIQVNGYEI